MSFIRPAVILVIILVIMILLPGCTEPKRTDGTGATPTKTPKKTAVPTTTVPTTAVPAAPGSCVEATLIPKEDIPSSPVVNYRPSSQVNLTENYAVISEKTLALSYNRTAFTCSFENPQGLIEYTLTVPMVTRRSFVTDKTGSEKTVSLTYPDPGAWFEVIVMDPGTSRVIARDGYGGDYDVTLSKKVWVPYPRSFYVEFTGNLVTADIKIRAKKGP